MMRATGTTIKLPEQAIKKGVVILDLAEYRKLQEKAVPTYYLAGKKAEELDKLVEEGLKDYHAGKTIKASSLSEAMKIYDKRKKNRKN